MKEENNKPTIIPGVPQNSIAQDESKDFYNSEEFRRKMM